MKKIDPAILKKIRVLRAYELASSSFTHPALPRAKKKTDSSSSRETAKSSKN